MFVQAVKDLLAGMQKGTDFSKWSAEDARKFVETVYASDDVRISKYLDGVEGYLDEYVQKGGRIMNRGLWFLPRVAFLRKFLRFCGEVGKPLKVLAVTFMAIAFSDDAKAYGYDVAVINASNPIPFVDLQDVVDIPALEPDMPPIPEPYKVYPHDFIGPLEDGAFRDPSPPVFLRLDEMFPSPGIRLDDLFRSGALK